MSNQNETVLITGASTGIGFAVARAFLDRGSNLVLNSRDPGRLEAAYEALGRPDNALLVAGDLSATRLSDNECLPAMREDAPPRESIEVRTFVVIDHNP